MSSMGEISVTLSAVNEISPVFEQVAADASAMGTNVDAASANFSDMSADANSAAGSLGQVASGLGAVNEVSLALAEVGANALTMSNDIETAGNSFNTMTNDAEQTTVSMRTLSSGISSFGRLGFEVTTVAGDFGLLNSTQEKYVRAAMTMIDMVGTAARAFNFLSLMTTGQSASLAVETTTENANTGSLSLNTIAQNIQSAAMGFATSVCDALNISYGTFLALTGVGIAVIIAASAAMLIFANNMKQATSSVQGFNTAAASTPAATSNIQRAGEQALLRRGIK